jgi:hypothetical protein
LSDRDVGRLTLLDFAVYVTGIDNYLADTKQALEDASG